MAFSRGDIIDGKYKVIEPIGRGGMGEVVLVEDCENGAHLALKYCTDVRPMVRRRFAREVRIMASIEHPHVMPVVQCDLEHDPPYFVMPLARCSGLDMVPQLCRNHDEAIRLFLETCKGVSAIHASGAVHRDIKPNNILIMKDGSAVVSDLGLARFNARDSTVLTETRDFLGTEPYAAPEQRDPRGSRDADQRTDVFQLGKTLLHLLTGSTLLEAGTLPFGLAHVIQKATREDPRDRYPSVDALVDAMNDYRQSLSAHENPRRALEQLVREASEGQRRDVLQQIVGLLVRCSDDDSTFIEMFDSVPNEVIVILAQRASEDIDLEPLMRAYLSYLYRNVSSREFSYAEIVAHKMALVFSGTMDLTTQQLAVNAILCAAVDLWRFNAIAVFERILLHIASDREALAVAQALREDMARYARIAGQVHRSQLHPVLQDVWDVAKAERSR